jgi:hypothetical protein
MCAAWLILYGDYGSSSSIGIVHKAVPSQPIVPLSVAPSRSRSPSRYSTVVPATLIPVVNVMKIRRIAPQGATAVAIARVMTTGLAKAPTPQSRASGEGSAHAGIAQRSKPLLINAQNWLGSCFWLLLWRGFGNALLVPERRTLLPDCTYRRSLLRLGLRPRAFSHPMDFPIKSL